MSRPGGNHGSFSFRLFSLTNGALGYPTSVPPFLKNDCVCGLEFSKAGSQYSGQKAFCHLSFSHGARRSRNDISCTSGSEEIFQLLIFVILFGFAAWMSKYNSLFCSGREPGVQSHLLYETLSASFAETEFLNELFCL